MARIQFDREQVLAETTRLFWQNGFSGCSMQDVFAATGLKPGSVYHAFGNKESLFKEALEHYADRSIAEIQRTLDAAPSVGQGVGVILTRMVEESSRQGYCSCFLVKSQLELAAANPDLHYLVSQQLERIEQCYAGYLEQEYAQEIASTRAASLMLHIFGIRVYGYGGATAEKQFAALEEGLPWLPWSQIRH